MIETIATLQEAQNALAKDARFKVGDIYVYPSQVTGVERTAEGDPRFLLADGTPLVGVPSNDTDASELLFKVLPMVEREAGAAAAAPFPPTGDAVYDSFFMVSNPDQRPQLRSIADGTQLRTYGTAQPDSTQFKNYHYPGGDYLYVLERQRPSANPVTTLVTRYHYDTEVREVVFDFNNSIESQGSTHAQAILADPNRNRVLVSINHRAAQPETTNLRGIGFDGTDQGEVVAAFENPNSSGGMYADGELGFYVSYTGVRTFPLDGNGAFSDDITTGLAPSDASVTEHALYLNIGPNIVRYDRATGEEKIIYSILLYGSSVGFDPGDGTLIFEGDIGDDYDRDFKSSPPYETQEVLHNTDAYGRLQMATTGL